jgi:lipoprotein-anchoring transpeptidase ErfK/SrfK
MDTIDRNCLLFCILFDIYSEVIGHFPMRFRTALTFLALSAAGTSTAFATSILAEVHIAAHRLNVFVGGKPTYSWGIATARRGYHTPRGTYHVTALDIDAYSRKYDASMPYAVCFIRGDYCIHAGHSIGRNASHGCIRLATPHAIRFFKLASANRGSTTIVVR